MVFSTDNLYRQENIIDNTPIDKNIIKVSENTSLFIDTLHYILEENILLENELAKYNSITYTNKKMLSLNEDNILQQALRGKVDVNININKNNSNVSNFFQKVKTNLTIENIIHFIINAFLTIIKKIWGEFEAICMNLVTKGSQIKRVSSRIMNIDRSLPYNQPVFIYTHTTDDTSRTDLQIQLNKIYDDLIRLLEKFKSIKNPRDVEMEINEFKRNQSYDEEYFSDIRGKMMNSSSLISRESYAEALFKYFRNGRTEPEIIGELSPDMIRSRLDKWEKEPKLIRLYRRDKLKLEIAGKWIESSVKRTKLDKYVEEVSTSLLQVYSDLVTNTARKVKETCNIFVLFYAQKLDAARAEFADNTKILFEAAKFVVREGIK